MIVSNYLNDEILLIDKIAAFETRFEGYIDLQIGIYI
jgi:hypothetical protein